jgi:serine/threonine protein kinase
MHHHMTLNDRNGNNESHIPEPAIWHIFESLIKAGLVMERGFANRRDERPDRGWQDIVHLDIKPDNVFIGDYPTDNPNKRSENFAMYPTFKLGDFGTSIFRRRKENYPDDADAYWSRGTPYYYAPEQRTQYHGQEYQGEEHPPLNAKTKHPSLDAKTNV